MVIRRLFMLTCLLTLALLLNTVVLAQEVTPSPTPTPPTCSPGWYVRFDGCDTLAYEIELGQVVPYFVDINSPPNALRTAPDNFHPLPDAVRHMLRITVFIPESAVMHGYGLLVRNEDAQAQNGSFRVRDRTTGAYAPLNFYYAGGSWIAYFSSSGVDLNLTNVSEFQIEIYVDHALPHNPVAYLDSIGLNLSNVTVTPTTIPTQPPSPTHTPTPDPNVRYVACNGPMTDVGRGLRVRREPNFNEYDSVFQNENVVDGAARGERLDLVDDVLTEGYDASGNRFWFLKVYFTPDPPVLNPQQFYYVAESVEYVGGGSDNFLWHTFEETGCEPPSTETEEIDPNDPERATYYRAYIGAAFWALYNETSEDSLVDHFDIVDGHPEASLITQPRPSFYDTPGGLPRDSAGIQPDPEYGFVLNGLNRRDHRYLIARVIFTSVPNFTIDRSLETDGASMYTTGFDYMRRWGGSLDRPGNLRLWGHEPDKCGLQFASYQAVYNTDVATDILNWLRGYADCRGGRTIGEPIFASDYASLMPYVLLAMNDQIAGVPNPVPVPLGLRTSQVKVANTCFVDAEDAPNGCSEGEREREPGYGVNMVAFCADAFHDCRNFDANGTRTYDTQGGYVAGPFSVEYWLTQFQPQTIHYPVDLYDDADYIAPATDVRTQVVYRTTVGYDYYVTVGFYTTEDGPDRNDDPDNRFMLMGLGIRQMNRDPRPEDPVTDNLETAFDRHWNRLNYGGQWLPQTFRPDYCMNGLSHVTIEVNGLAAQWITLTYQSTNDFADDNWFCREG